MVRVHLVLVLSLLFAACIVSAAFSANAPIHYNDYTEVPGVTEEEIARIEELKRSRPDGLSYGIVYSDEAFRTSDGGVGGFTRLLCEEMTRLFGITVTPDIVAWDDLLTGLDGRGIDLSGDLTATPERRAKYRMTTPIAERSFMVYHHVDRGDIDLINGDELYRYGFFDGSVTHDRVRETSEVPFTPVFLGNFREAVAAMRSGLVDAFICEAMSDSVFENYQEIACQKYYPVAFTSVSLGTANPEAFPIIDVFQKYLDNGGERRLSELYVEGGREYRRHKFRKKLDDDEKAYLDSRREQGTPIPLVAEFDNYPASFYNQREGEWQGVAHEIIEEIKDLSGLDFEIINSPDEVWSAILEKLEKGEAALITGLVPSKDRAGRFIWSEAPYLRDRYALLSRMETDDIPISRVRSARVGLVRGTVYEEAFHRIFPEHRATRVYPDTVSPFQALDAGEVDLVMLTRNLLLSVTSFMERPGFKVNVPIDLSCDAYFGFNREQALLRSVVDKAQCLIDCDSIVDRWQRKTFDYDKKLAQERIPYLVGISALLLVVLLLVSVIYAMRVRTSRILSMTDPLTLLANKRSFDAGIQSAWSKAVSERLQISLLTIDIDFFKLYNDTHGHPQGDLLLREIAKVFKCAVKRTSDIVARTGGEEFCVVLPNTDSAGAAAIAERIRAEVEAARVENAETGEATSVTVSVGVVSEKPHPGDSMEDFIARSDKALYAAKQEGRNRVCVL